jgi:fucose permease
VVLDARDAVPRGARSAVLLSFFLNGFGFATWVSRIPEVRAELSLSNSQLGLLLLAIAAGSVLTLPTTGAFIDRFGAAAVARVGVASDAVGLAVAAVGVGVLGSVPLTAVGLFAYGLGVGVWDVAMNVEGAAVEKRLGRTVMPRFHAAFSLGTVAAAGLGALATGLGVPMLVHLGAVAVVVLLLAQPRRFLPRAERAREQHGSDGAGVARSSARRAWREPRTLLIGVLVFALAVTEGTANDWLAVALIDGYGVEHWVGVLGFAGFVAAMTAGRGGGPVLLDRFGRVPVLWGTMAAAGAGVLLIVYGGPLAVPGILLWGLGASLGFPVGMSAAADDERHAAVRVSVVSTIAYTAFLAGPPLLGFVADRVGSLDALLVVALLLVPSALVVPAARERA